MPRHILVTGGLGFIGSHLVQDLLRDPEVMVTVCDNLSGTVLEADTIVREITHNRPGKLSVCLVPVADLQALSVPAFETIYHLASVVGPAGVLRHSGYIAESIVRDTYVVIRLAQSCRSRLVNVSTSEVYGGGVGGLCREDTPRVIKGTASARQEYAVGKLAAEVAIENLCREDRLDAVSVRPFNVAGPRQSGRGGFVLPRFVGQAILGRPLTLFGDGSQVRALTDVRDVAAGLVLCATCGLSGDAINLGNPHGRLSIAELADRVLAMSGSRAGKVLVDPQTIHGNTFAEAADKFPDATKILELGWRPKSTLDDTVRDTWHAMRDLPEEQLLLVAGLEAACTSHFQLEGACTSAPPSEVSRWP